MMKTGLKSLSTAGILSLALGGASTLADPLPMPYDFFTFDQNSGFDLDTTALSGEAPYDGLPPPTAVTEEVEGLFFNGIYHTGAPAGSETGFKWKGANGRDDRFSDILLNSYDTSDSPSAGNALLGDVGADGVWGQGENWIISGLVQNNQPLVSLNGIWPDPLWIADAVSNLFIRDAGDIIREQDLNSSSVFSFWETKNRNSPAGCTNPNPLGTACDDIYRTALTSFAPLGFQEDGWQYRFNFNLLPGPSSSLEETLICSNFGNEADMPAICQGLGIGPGEVWIFTGEDSPGFSTLYVTLNWTASLIPEPSAIALFGIGILGAGLATRRRRKAKS